MTVPDGFQPHESDVSSAGPGRVASEPGVYVRLVLGWYGGMITPQSTEEVEQARGWLPCDS